MKLIPRQRIAPAVVLLFLTMGGPQAATAWKGVEEIHGASPVTVSVEGNSRRYFQVSPQQPLTVEIKGPVRLRVISRVEVPEGATGKVAYGLRITEGKRTLRSLKTEAEKSNDAKPPRKGAPLGQSRQTIVSLKEGAHTLRIAAQGERSMLVRLQTAATRPGRPETVSLTPIDARRSVSLKEGEKVIPYYSAMAGKPVKFRVVGPTTLELLTRLDFDQTMRGVQSYRLRVTAGASRPRETELSTTKALTATWVELPDRVPSKFRRMQIPIAEGTQEVTVELVKPAEGSVEIHARIPQIAVGNKE